MTGDKRYELKEYHGNELFIQDNTNNVQYYSRSKASLNKLVDGLNDQEKQLQKMRFAFKQKYDYDIEEVVQEVYDYWGGLLVFK